VLAGDGFVQVHDSMVVCWMAGACMFFYIVFAGVRLHGNWGDCWGASPSTEVYDSLVVGWLAKPAYIFILCLQVYDSMGIGVIVGGLRLLLRYTTLWLLVVGLAPA
jgi:hypothetical protein